jgi:hypothetical protein
MQCGCSGGVCSVGVCSGGVCSGGVCSVAVCSGGVCSVGVCSVGVCSVVVCSVGVCSVVVCSVGVCSRFPVDFLFSATTITDTTIHPSSFLTAIIHHPSFPPFPSHPTCPLKIQRIFRCRERCSLPCTTPASVGDAASDRWRRTGHAAVNARSR